MIHRSQVDTYRYVVADDRTALLAYSVWRQPYHLIYGGLCLFYTATIAVTTG